MDGEFREVQLEDVIEIRVEPAAFRVAGKVMYCEVEVGSLLNHLLFRNFYPALLLVWIYKL